MEELKQVDSRSSLLPTKEAIEAMPPTALKKLLLELRAEDSAGPDHGSAHTSHTSHSAHSSYV